MNTDSFHQALIFDKNYHHELDDDWRTVVTSLFTEIDRLRGELASWDRHVCTTTDDRWDLR